MPVTPTYPGVYVQEVPSGVRTIAGVSTSVGMFIGTSNKGPLFEPVRCINYSAFRTKFGEDATAGSLAQYVKLFFLNGGTDCYVMRIAQNAGAATVKLKTEAGVETLRLTAKDRGALGENIRALVTYNGSQPEVTFNLELFRWELDSTGARTKTAGETWRNLSMDPASPTYAPAFISQNSQLVDAADLNAAPGAGTTWGFSLSGRPVPNASTATPFKSAWESLLGSTATTNRFKISLSGSPYIDVSLHTLVVTDTAADLTNGIAGAIQMAFGLAGYPGVNVTVSLVSSVAGNRLRITRASGANGDVFIRRGTTSGSYTDVAALLMLGTEQGGIEVGAFAGRRPAPTGVTFNAFQTTNIATLGDLAQKHVTTVALEAVNDTTGATVLTTLNLQSGTPSVITAGNGDRVAKDAFTTSGNGHSDGVREKLAIIAQRINEYTPTPGQSWPWQAETYGYRLAVRPTDALADNFVSSFALTTDLTTIVVAPPPGAALPATAFTKNVHYYTVGFDGANQGSQTSAAAAASDGTPPVAADYAAAYEIIDREVDLFNLMVLPPVANEVVTVHSLYGDASLFCQARRAFLIMDPPASWTSAQAASTGIAALRVGLAKDYSALFHPRITINEAGLEKNIGPAGAMAGLFARIDGTRGVWKAPAGTEADLRGVTGLEYRFSDGENGLLNPKAVNTLRVFPNGIVSWGARTMDGDNSFGSEYKYIPIRRLALYMEESLYRGLKWVVFEPNDEPLWSQIRLNVGSFMHNLFRQGAFQGRTPKEAYFVKCDAETTTQADRDLGIVNIWVGFAPLKPAEFVILYLQQMAGQIET